VRAILAFGVAIMLGLGNLAPVEARDRNRVGLDDPTLADSPDAFQNPEPFDQIAQEDQGIPPSEAAAIARDQVPGAKVVGVKLLSNGWYAVTLRTKGSVTRVMVNASDGSVR
jgi:uncharacterized membrane protein YkoI